MDFISHGLWAYALVRKVKFWPIVFFATFPDFIWVYIGIATNIFGKTFPMKEVVLEDFPDVTALPIYPDYVYTLYDIPHSLIICALVFLIIFLIKKKIYLAMLGWPIHILLDIPSHIKEFFPTKFLYPLSSYSVDGIAWTLPSFFIPNVILLTTIYSYFLYKHYQKKKIKNQ